MESWSMFWLIVLVVTILAFVPLALVVAVGGWLDIRHLFRALRKSKQEKVDEEATTGRPP